MALADPVAVYNARDNFEAQALQLLLENSGIEAAAVDDDSVVGLWMFGLLPEIHKPQLWVNRQDVDQARALIEQYEAEARERRIAEKSQQHSNGQIEVVCEDCGKSSAFPASQRGTIQDCPFCSAYVDVGEVDFDEGQLEPEADS